MYTYLNYCPPPILNLYKDLFKTATPKEIVLALISMMKLADNSDKTTAEKVFYKLTEISKTQNFEIIDGVPLLVYS